MHTEYEVRVLEIDKEEIVKRMISRNEPEESMQLRLKDYDVYVENAKYFDHVIVNITIDHTIDQILSIIEQTKKNH